MQLGSCFSVQSIWSTKERMYCKAAAQDWDISTGRHLVVVEQFLLVLSLKMDQIELLIKALDKAFTGF